MKYIERYPEVMIFEARARFNVHTTTNGIKTIVMMLDCVCEYMCVSNTKWHKKGNKNSEISSAKPQGDPTRNSSMNKVI